MKPDEYLQELKDALAEYRFEDVTALTETISPVEFSTDQAKEALGLMRRKRLFSEMEKTAGLFSLSGKAAPIVKRQYAQALLDQNRITQGLSVLEKILPDVADDPNELSEVWGLKGRGFKQLYVNEGDTESLRNAIQAYAPCWRKPLGDHRWHGVNLAALLHRAKVDGVDPGVSDNYQDIATSILHEITSLGQTAQVWDYATATEAAIALGNDRTALEWAGRYILHGDTDAFELGSTLRQLKEVWRLEGTGIGNKLLPVMEFALLQREGGTLQLSAANFMDTSGFEAVFGAESSINIVWMDTMLQRCSSVARVFNTATGQRIGTGFLMNGAELRPEWGDAPVFVTNAHVVSNNPADNSPLMPEDTSAEFTRLPDRPKYEMGELLFSSPRSDLDVSVMRIKPSVETAPLKPTSYLPLVSKDGDAPQRIYVVGHPNGAEMTVTLYDNDLVGYVDNRYVRYRSPTEPGHSGSPVFNREWKLFAIHHRAVREEQVNEGVLMRAVREGTWP